MKLLCRYFFVFLLFAATPLFASGVGSVKNVDGQAWIVRGEEKMLVQPGNRLFINDILKTGNDGALGVILHDDTIISMGPVSEMVLAEFLFQPELGKFALLTKFIKGTFTYLSGVMAKIAPESVKVETPVGMVAVRGTHFLIKVEE